MKNTQNMLSDKLLGLLVTYVENHKVVVHTYGDGTTGLCQHTSCDNCKAKDKCNDVYGTDVMGLTQEELNEFYEKYPEYLIP